ncbi:MAG: hypothetical protein AAB316_23365 [Bacteroidota bacterium]
MKNNIIFCLLLLAAGCQFCYAQDDKKDWRRYLSLADTVVGSAMPVLRFDPGMAAPIRQFLFHPMLAMERGSLYSVVFQEPAWQPRGAFALHHRDLGMRFDAPNPGNRRSLLELPMILGAGLLDSSQDWSEVLDRAWERRMYPDFVR